MTVDTLANLIGGEFIAASEGRVIDVINPADGTLVGRVPALRASDVTAVFDAAAAGAKAWRAAGALARGRVLLDAAVLLRAEASELTELIVSEMGKTRAEARGEVGKAAEFFETTAGSPSCRSASSSPTRDPVPTRCRSASRSASSCSSRPGTTPC